MRSGEATVFLDKTRTKERVSMMENTTVASKLTFVVWLLSGTSALHIGTRLNLAKTFAATANQDGNSFHFFNDHPSEISGELGQWTYQARMDELLYAVKIIKTSAMGHSSCPFRATCMKLPGDIPPPRVKDALIPAQATELVYQIFSSPRGNGTATLTRMLPGPFECRF